MSPSDAATTFHSSPGETARLACIMEVCAPKAGNVHPAVRFRDVTHEHFIASAEAIKPILSRATSQCVGQTILDCVIATQQAAGSNTNLGIILLLAPLCAVPLKMPIESGILKVLDDLTVEDAALTYEAIRLAKPGGLGRVKDADVEQLPRINLKQAMSLAADRDAIARQYVCGFQDVIESVAHDLAQPPNDTAMTQADCIVLAHLKQMAREPDSLIHRKCGDVVAQESAARAQAVIDAGWPRGRESGTMFATLDRWLREDGHRRNPGTSADLIAAGLFVAMRQGRLQPDFNWLKEHVS